MNWSRLLAKHSLQKLRWIKPSNPLWREFPEISCGFQYIHAGSTSSSDLQFPDRFCSIIKRFDEKVDDLLLPQLVIHSPFSPVMCYVTSTHLPFRVYSTLISDTSSVVYTTFANSQRGSQPNENYANHNIYITSCTKSYDSGPPDT